MSRGRLFVISAPSGSGKTTLIQALKKRIPELARSLSVTTRPRRRGEKPGRDYRFLGERAFLKARAQGKFLESARILGHWYGTPLAPIRRMIAQDRDVLLGLDIQGASQLRRKSLPVTTIFLLAPSLATLRRRLTRRGTETPAQIRSRLALARRELRELKKYDYAVVNDHLPQAVDQVLAILKAEQCRIRR